MITTETQEERVQYIIDNFDFNKVQNFISYNNILWDDDKGKIIPTIDKMKETCKKLLYFVINKGVDLKDDVSFQIMGFRASCKYKEINTKAGELNFLTLEYLLESTDDDVFRMNDSILRREKIESVLKKES